MKKNKIGIGQNATLVTVTGINDTNAHVLAPPTGALVIEDMDNVSFVLQTTGTLVATWTIQGANDFVTQGEYNGVANTGTWIDITALFSSIAAVASSPANRYTQAVGLCARAVRAVFTPSSGTGSIAGFPFAKGAQ